MLENKDESTKATELSEKQNSVKKSQGRRKVKGKAI